jgi:hypothetical protein
MTDSELLKAMARQLDRMEYNQRELEKALPELQKAMFLVIDQILDDVDDDQELDLDGNLGARERDDTQPL